MRSTRSARTPRLALQALAALMFAAPGLASAQSLQELYQAARAYDATYLAALSSAQAAEYRAAQSDALARPSVAATAAATAAKSDIPTLSGLRNTNTVSGSVNGRYPLFNRANDVTIEQAQRLLSASKADLQTAEQDLIVRVSQAYFDVLAAMDTLGTTRTSKKAITEQLASAKRNFEVGTATITDTREAQARFDLSTAQELQAENDLRAKRIALDQLVGRSNVTPFSLVVPLPLPALVPSNVEEWVTVADQQHPAVQRARLALEVATLETRKARAGALPTVDAIAGISSADSQGSAVTLRGTTTTASVGVQMNWPLYTGGSVQNRIKETLSLEEKAQSDLSAARRAVAQATRIAYFNVLTGQAQVKALEAAESSSKLALEATQLGYKVGVRVNLDVLNAQTQLFTTQRDLARARYDVVLGNLRLRQAAGQLSADDVLAANKLLAP